MDGVLGHSHFFPQQLFVLVALQLWLSGLVNYSSWSVWNSDDWCLCWWSNSFGIGLCDFQGVSFIYNQRSLLNYKC